MFWCETGSSDARAIENLAVFVSQLNGLGVGAGVDVRAVPPDLHRTVRFDIAPYLLEAAIEPTDQVALIGADKLADTKLVEFRRLLATGQRSCIAFGRFESRQKLIGIKAKLSYVFNQDPRIVNLIELGGPGADQGGEYPVFGAVRHGIERDAAGRVRLLVVNPPLNDPQRAAALSALATSRQVDLAMLTDGEAKQAWLATRGTGTPVYNYGEILPFDLCDRADIVFCMAPLNNYRLQCLIANAAVSGIALLDGTTDHAIARTTDAFLRAPSDLVTLAAFLRTEVIPNLAEIRSHVLKSSFAKSMAGARIATLLGADADAGVEPARGIRSARSRVPLSSTKVVFMPTNGVGLGHAQRCTLVAAELDRSRVDPAFAAFPSCTGLVKAYGFDVMPLVQRSSLHLRSYENDIANYVRLKALTKAARALVFDGGFVFNSVYRTIVENRLSGIWLRRGLWQAQQDNTIALDRAKVFSRVIVPTEAFEELNDERSQGAHVHSVGPIVRRHSLDAVRRDRLRRDLALRYDLPFERLVVTQLGGGVAADRGAQIQALCGMMERRPDVLHLVLVWPTAVLQPGWFGWSRSRVVKTLHAGVLAASADLCISAAGYNSFHEILYGALPAILVPQTGAGMDDQTARARAAYDRDLVGLVEPHELMALDRAILRFLDAGEGAAAKRRLAALELPPPGNRRAAALIEELTDGSSALDQPLAADRSA